MAPVKSHAIPLRFWQKPTNNHIEKAVKPVFYAGLRSFFLYTPIIQLTRYMARGIVTQAMPMKSMYTPVRIMVVMGM